MLSTIRSLISRPIRQGFRRDGKYLLNCSSTVLRKHATTDKGDLRVQRISHHGRGAGSRPAAVSHGRRWSSRQAGRSPNRVRELASAAAASTTKTGETIIAHTFHVAALAVDEANPVNFTAATVGCAGTDHEHGRHDQGEQRRRRRPTRSILKANTPWVWIRDSGITFPLTGTAGAFTNFFISNAHATLEAIVKVRGVAPDHRGGIHTERVTYGNPG